MSLACGANSFSKKLRAVSLNWTEWKEKQRCINFVTCVNYSSVQYNNTDKIRDGLVALFGVHPFWPSSSFWTRLWNEKSAIMKRNWAIIKGNWAIIGWSVRCAYNAGMLPVGSWLAFWHLPIGNANHMKVIVQIRSKLWTQKHYNSSVSSGLVEESSLTDGELHILHSSVC